MDEKISAGLSLIDKIIEIFSSNYESTNDEKFNEILKDLELVQSKIKKI